MSERVASQRANISAEDIVATVDQREGASALHERDRPTRASAVLDKAGDLAEPERFRVSRRLGLRAGVGDDRRVNVDAQHSPLQLLQRIDLEHLPYSYGIDE